MTIAQAILEIGKIKPHAYSEETIIRWLSELDGRVMEDLIQNYTDVPVASKLPYKTEDQLTELLIPFPHEDVYMTWLMAKIDFTNSDLDRYNNDMLMWQEQYQGFLDSYTRGHQQKPVYITGVRGGFA